MKNLVALLVLVAFVLIVPAVVYAADPVPAVTTPVPAAADDAAADETEFSFGTVKIVKENQLVVTEYDYESNADVDVTYQVAPDTEYENVTALKEVTAGDSVDVDYLVVGDQKKAVAITVEKPLTQEEEAALATEETDAAAAKE